MKKRSPRYTLAIVVVNWNAGALLSRCLLSIENEPPGCSYEVVIVDNASTDETVGLMERVVARAEGDVRVLQNEDNLGFARACNQGIQESSSEFVLLLNPDTEVLPGSLDQLLETVRRHPEIGVCGPRLVGRSRQLQASAWRAPPAAWQTLVEGLGLARLVPQPFRGEWLLGTHWDHRRRRRVGALSGAALLARREMIESVGGLDERHHMYGEDGEWCVRMGRRGWWCYFEPEAVVMHCGGHSAAQRWGVPERRLREIRGFLLFQSTCLSRAAAFRNSLARTLVLSVHWLKSRLAGRPTRLLEEAWRLHVKTLRQSARTWIKRR